MDEYRGMIPDYTINIKACSEKEAQVNIILELKNKFETLSVDELIQELGIIVWKE